MNWYGFLIALVAIPAWFGLSYLIAGGGAPSPQGHSRRRSNRLPHRSGHYGGARHGMTERRLYRCTPPGGDPATYLLRPESAHILSLYEDWSVVDLDNETTMERSQREWNERAMRTARNHDIYS